MNPLTNVRNITKLNERELSLGIDQKNSWHNMYSSSAWVFVGGLNYDLSEGDVITVFSQYGEIVNINLIRDQKTGKSKGFCFLCYEDQRSTVLAVDNLNGIKLLNRIIRVDHVSEYKIPKEHEDMDEVTKRLHLEGCAPREQIIKDEPKDRSPEERKSSKEENKSERKHKKKKRRRSTSSDSSSSSDARLNSRHSNKRIDKREDHKHSHKSSSDRSRHSDHRSDRNKSKHKSKKDSKD